VSLLINISALGIATCNGLDSPRIESWRVRFSTPIQMTWGLPNLLCNGCRIILGGKAAVVWH